MGKAVDILSTIGEAPGKALGLIPEEPKKPKQAPGAVGADPHRGDELAAARKRAAAAAAGGGRRSFRIDLQSGAADAAATRSGLRIG